MASAAEAPLLLPVLRWQSDLRGICSWSRTEAPQAKDKSAAIASAAQNWCRWFEAELRDNPQNWLFWLDKRWSRFLRATPQRSQIS